MVAISTAAAHVRPILPETGVCSLDRRPAAAPTAAAAAALLTVPDVQSACCG